MQELLIYKLVCKAYLDFSVEGGTVPMADHHPTCSSSSANSDDDDDDLTVDVTSIEDVTVAAEEEGEEGEDPAAG